MPRSVTFALLFCLTLLIAGCSDSGSPNSDSSSQEPKPAGQSSFSPNKSSANTSPQKTLAKTNAGRNEQPSAAKFDWPHWRGPNRDGVSTETKLIREFPEAGPQVVWRKPLGTGFSGLTVTGGRVFTLFGEDDREKIVCFDALNGDEIWKIGIGSRLCPGP